MHESFTPPQIEDQLPGGASDQPDDVTPPQLEDQLPGGVSDQPDDVTPPRRCHTSQKISQHWDYVVVRY